MRELESFTSVAHTFAYEMRRNVIYKLKKLI